MISTFWGNSYFIQMSISTYSGRWQRNKYDKYLEGKHTSKTRTPPTLEGDPARDFSSFKNP
jgi:hypothetical protein